MGLLSFLGIGNKSRLLKEMLEKGAVIIDVRTTQEFNTGHVKKSVNIPLDNIKRELKKIQGYKKPIITCCASGMRSGAAASALKQAGVESVNGGGWRKVDMLVKDRIL